MRILLTFLYIIIQAIVKYYIIDKEFMKCALFHMRYFYEQQYYAFVHGYRILGLVAQKFLHLLISSDVDISVDNRPAVSLQVLSERVAEL